MLSEVSTLRQDCYLDCIVSLIAQSSPWSRSDAAEPFHLTQFLVPILTPNQPMATGFVWQFAWLDPIWLPMPLLNS